MGESRDPVIKLFGNTIQLLAITEVVAIAGDEVGGYEKKAPSNKQDDHEPEQKKEATRIFQEEERIDERNISETKEESADDQKNRNINNSVDKKLQKPDKILPCRRCSSMDTKFCYFNNYNVNQPRHFCKKCQRYWTEGGSMRNVPVGAGRRKSKSSATNHHFYRHITIPDCVQADCCESINHPSSLKLKGTILSFGAHAPCFESTDPTGEDRLTPYLGMPWLCSGLNSTVLGKHYREGNLLNHSNSGKEGLAKSDKCLLIPKTGKLDGHENAVNCSVWTKLGFKNDKTDRFLTNRSTEASQVLCANPAALSRALSFQERS